MIYQDPAILVFRQMVVSLIFSYEIFFIKAKLAFLWHVALINE
jgi:hypothetical protein